MTTFNYFDIKINFAITLYVLSPDLKKFVSQETWQNFEFKDCLKEVETWFRDEDTQKSKLLPDFEDMGWVKWCMTNKKQELKVRFSKLFR